MASYRQRKQPSHPSPSVLRSGSRFHKAESLSSEASSPVGRRQKCIDSSRYYAQSESETSIGKLQQDPWDISRRYSEIEAGFNDRMAEFGYVTEFPALNDPELRQKSEISRHQTPNSTQRKQKKQQAMPQRPSNSRKQSNPPSPLKWRVGPGFCYEK